MRGIFLSAHTYLNMELVRCESKVSSNPQIAIITHKLTLDQNRCQLKLIINEQKMVIYQKIFRSPFECEFIKELSSRYQLLA